MLANIPENVLARAKKIRLVIFDVDGVLTDGRLFIGDDGQNYKAFYARDGFGIKILQKTGVEIGIITGNTSNVVTHRMHSLGIQHVFQGRVEKLPAFEELCEALNLQPEQVAFVGDDVIDVPIMLKAGLAVTVADAHPLVVDYAHWQTPSVGGFGAAREVCELIMRAQGTLAEQFGFYGVQFPKS